MNEIMKIDNYHSLSVYNDNKIESTLNIKKHIPENH